MKAELLLVQMFEPSTRRSTMPQFFLFLFLLIYVAIGTIIATPYCLLSQGGPEVHMIITYLGPIISVVCFGAFLIGRSTPEMPDRKGIFYRTGGWLFWSLMGFLAAPIVMNGISILLKNLGIVELGQFVFNNRFTILAIIPVLGAVAVVVRRLRDTVNILPTEG